MNQPNPRPSSWRRFLAPAAVLVSLAALLPLALPAAGQNGKARSSSSPAKNLDIGLLKQAPKILNYLSDQGYRNVAVLPFKVKKGTRQAGYYSAPLATNLPGRLENALLMAMGDDEKTALNIIRDAAGTANQQKVGQWSRNKAAFDRLFSVSYPRAWGNQSVRPDVFLTGIVTNSGDRATTTIEIECFTKKSWSGGSVKRFPVSRFSVKTDRALLRDLGYNFALAARSVVRRSVSAQARDQQAIQQVTQEETGQKPPQGGQQTGHSAKNIAGMAFAIYYNGVKQTINPLTEGQSGAKSPLFQVDPMPPGAKIEMELTRVSDENRRLGVILKVNGKSTFQQEELDSLQCRKWLYDLVTKDKPDRLHGCWMDTEGKQVLPFKVLTAQESAAKASELGERAGWIDIDVFASGEAPDKDEQMAVSTRGLARGAARPKTLKALQAKLMKTNNVRHRETKVQKRTAGGLLLFDPEPVPGAPLSVADLPNPVRLGGISIKYYDRQGMTISE
jgi:hypothetical protein